MTDGWEVSHGIDPTTDTSADDPDGDGHSNLDECLGGSDPLDSGSTPDDAGTESFSCSPGSVRPGQELLAAVCVLLALLARRRAVTQAA
jgi:hypothetical protein